MPRREEAQDLRLRSERRQYLRVDGEAQAHLLLRELARRFPTDLLHPTISEVDLGLGVQVVGLRVRRQVYRVFIVEVQHCRSIHETDLA